MSKSRKNARPARERRARVEKAFLLKESGLSVKEIALEMNIAIPTVYSFFQDPDASKMDKSRRRSSPVGRKGKKPVPIEDRFWTHVEKGPEEDSCWLWKNHKSDRYHPKFTIQRTPCIQAKAHRFAYELLVGKIPDGHVVHHICEIKHCVNPKHLELKKNQSEHARDHATFAGDRGRSTQLKGAESRHRKLMDITLPRVLQDLCLLMLVNDRPTYELCAKIQGYRSVYRYYSHEELLNMARKTHHSYEATREAVLVEWREET